MDNTHRIIIIRVRVCVCTRARRRPTQSAEMSPDQRLTTKTELWTFTWPLKGVRSPYNIESKTNFITKIMYCLCQNTLRIYIFYIQLHLVHVIIYHSRHLQVSILIVCMRPPHLNCPSRRHKQSTMSQTDHRFPPFLRKESDFQPIANFQNCNLYEKGEFQRSLSGLQCLHVYIHILCENEVAMNPASEKNSPAQNDIAWRTHMHFSYFVQAAGISFIRNRLYFVTDGNETKQWRRPI